jgi:hypothetical protein
MIIDKVVHLLGKSFVLVLVFLFKSQLLLSQDFKIIAHSDNRITTHKLKSGLSGFEIGITSNGGGVINFVNFPGIGDIMKLASDRYGRAGQLAFRDSSHGGSYNPTQAGYNEDIGTRCEIIKKENKLIIPQRGMALWFGDNRNDFTHWENIGSDSKDTDGGNSDTDGLDESNLEGKQKTEVFSEFDYYGIYEDVYGQNDITVGAIRHYFEVSFIREPGHCLNQFRAGTPLYNGNALRNDISKKFPLGKHPGTDKDMNGVTAVWSLRNDVARWNYSHVYFRTTTGQWNVFEADVNVPSNADHQIMILAESNNPNSGRGYCLYKPNTEINNFPIIGVNENTGTIAYKDERIFLSNEGTKMSYDKFRAPAMSKYGFSNKFSGLINRTRLDDNIFEAYRGEYYILYGTPQQIMDNISKIEGLKISQYISFPKLEDKIVGDTSFYPGAYSDSKLPISYTSSNTDVAIIESGKIVIVGPGKTTITANQSGNNTYLKAEAASQELTVNNNSLSTDEFNNKKENILIYPNPSSGVYQLSEVIEYSIYDITGREIISGKGKSIDLSTHVKGVYFLHFKNITKTLFKY